MRSIVQFCHLEYRGLALAAAVAGSLAAGCAVPEDPVAAEDPLAQLPREDFSYELPDGQILVGTGIRLSDDMLLVGGDAIIPRQGGKGPAKAHVAATLWPSRVIAYDFDPAVSQATRQRVLSAMNPWRAAGFIFRQRTTQADFVRITTEYNQNGIHVPTWVCAADVGFVAGSTYWAGADCRTRDFVHEWGHVLGLYHEHARADRNLFVQVDTTRITEQIGRGTASGGYDFGSIMHYDAFDRHVNGAVDEAHVLIRPLDGRDLHSFGWNETPSGQDLATLSSLYASRAPGVPLYQVYNQQYQDWFYTIDPSERGIALSLGYIDYGVAARVEAAAQGGTAAFWRFYKGPPQTDHFYTTSPAEFNLVISYGWGYEREEGNLFVSPVEGTTALYRYAHWDPATGDLMHFYTVDASLYGPLINGGWGYDGVAGYAYAPY